VSFGALSRAKRDVQHAEVNCSPSSMWLVTLVRYWVRNAVLTVYAVTTAAVSYVGNALRKCANRLITPTTELRMPSPKPVNAVTVSNAATRAS
jgi:hypothetical protein